MKQVYTIKDIYQDHSVRVNYFEKDAIREFKQLKRDEETKKMEIITVQETYDNLLFCERLFWELDETELNAKIEETRQRWEERINN